ncbi:ZYRO0C12254p [Zygosaccharomyces rouxii]|uniref:ZYRO0C12254p n=2 Tax=Zygosaccharomyces rouxii TaxID=4956 RepID=C5DTY3_ZYGRC|nr:uncharacterized protein ZYRO0C12254g [Zygosaccharomyces rouxii]KAH9201580.1 putative DNA-binding protein SNT1 [Zygosaccharomyces rouxii]CAQ43545.1 Probable DNA-binding protein SNT1 [Zygosaccharomyces rouxii]CAR27244.1 ZYRO0C12254p [Zygosaccharomyces rouxii]
MSHPPSHRVGDKRRYYYYSGNPRAGGFKKGYSNGPTVPQSAGPGPINRPSRYDPHSPRKPINTNSSSATVPPTAAPAPVPAPAPAPAPTTTRVGSRYNPDVGTSSSTSMMDGPLNGGGSRYSGSRYNPQPRPRLSLDSATTSSNINSATGYYSRSNKWRMGSVNPNKLDYDSPSGPSGSNGRPSFWKSQKRPSAPISSRVSPHSLPPQVQSSRSNSPVPSQVGPPMDVTVPANVPPQSHSQPHSQSHSQPHTRSPSTTAEAVVTTRPAQVKAETPEEKGVPMPGRSPATAPVQTKTPVPTQSHAPAPAPIPASVPSHAPTVAPASSAAVTRSPAPTASSTASSTSASSTVPSKVESPASASASATVPAPAPVPAPVHTSASSKVEAPAPVVKPTSTPDTPTPVVTKDKQEKSKQEKDKQEKDKQEKVKQEKVKQEKVKQEKDKQEKDKQEKDKEEASKVQDNPHSLGSSLINSVPQQTRKLEHRDSNSEDEESDNNYNNNYNNNKNNETDNNNNNIDNNNEDNNNNRRSSSLWSLQKETTTTISDTTPTLEPVFKENLYRHEDYEYVYDPHVLKQDLNSLEPKQEKKYDEPLRPLGACIFPMTREQTRLWELKNQPWDQIVARQHHRLKNPITDLRTYPFVRQNTIMHKQALKPLLCSCISKLKRNEYLRKLKLKKDAHIVDEQWQDKCKKMDAMSHELRKEEIHRKERQEVEASERERKEKRLQERQGKLLGSSRRRNRADFVDDAEMENVLLQIDPVYKHIQSAAEIPPMIMNPLQRNAFKFKDVNNLVTDKDGWARRIKQDGKDTFAPHEHELFVEAYLSFPKKFLKISNYLGGLRTPEECVLHYYRTKSTVDYKKLLNEKNKKRQKSNAIKRNRKRERASDTDNEGSLSMSEHGDKRKESSVDPMEDEEARSIKHMEQVEIRVPQSLSTQIHGSSSSSPQINGTKHQSPSNDSGTIFNPEDTQRHIESPITNTPTSLHKADNGDNYEQQLQLPQEPMTKLTDASMENGESAVVKAFTSSAPFDHRGRGSDIANEDGQQRKRHKTSGEHKSSYWSVKEATLFPDLLKQYGSQWSMISEKLGTKSTTMVRNYYQRNAAQFGWKPLVEEADFKRNATSSGSVQQSQILLQSEQAPFTVSNGVPSQLWPALGFFTNSNENAANTTNDSSNQESPPMGAIGETQPTSLTPQVSTAETPQQPFSSTFNNKEPLFHEASAPANGLPAPRLPSILLPISSENRKEKPASSGSRLKNLLNDEGERKFKPSGPELNRMNETNAPPLPPATAAPAISTEHTQLTSAVRPQISNLVVQELQKTESTFPNNNRRSSSLSLLLNPDNDRPVARAPLAPLASQKQYQVQTPPVPQSPSTQPSSINHTNQQQTQQPPQQQQPSQQHMDPRTSAPAPKISFAMDPLGALAAVASESLLETDKSNQ